jgi:Tol biopolymer transport system component
MMLQKSRCIICLCIFVCCYFYCCTISLAADAVQGHVFIRDNNIWVKTADDVEKKISDDEVTGLSVSENGKIIYSVLEDPNFGTQSLYYMSIGDSNAKKIDVIPTSHYSISKNGLFIAYSKVTNRNSQGGHIFSVNKKTKSIIPFDPFPKILRDKDGNWNWHVDGPYYWSKDGTVIAFGRCSGDLDKPKCMIFYKTVKSSDKPVLVGESLLKNRKLIPQFHLIGISEENIYFDDTERLYSYSISTKKIIPVVSDAQCSSISPDGKFISYMSTFRTKGGANLYVTDIDGKNTRALTNYKNLDINSCHTGWSPDSKQINVILRISELNNNIAYPAWKINIDGSNLTRIVDEKEAYVGLWITMLPASFIGK